MNHGIFAEIDQSLSGGWSGPQARIQITGTGELPSWFDVTGLATASFAAAGAEISGLLLNAREISATVNVDQRLASLWFGWSLQPSGWTLPSPWDPIAGDYEAADSQWIRLHTNATHHRAAALLVLGVDADRVTVADAVAIHSADELEAAIIEAGGCAAAMRSLAQWRKHCAGLDLKTRQDRLVFESLLRDADILMHGYRPGALAGLSYDSEALQTLNPTLITVSLCAYGWTGPWRHRRGFDSLVQMSTGIADAGMRRVNTDRPTPLPVQALDHATGYLAAAAALRALRARKNDGVILSARVSLARTAHLLIPTLGAKPESNFESPTDLDLAPEIEQTDWGPARRIKFPVWIGKTSGYFSSPARALRADSPRWRMQKI